MTCHYFAGLERTVQVQVYCRCPLMMLLAPGQDLYMISLAKDSQIQGQAYAPLSCI